MIKIFLITCIFLSNGELKSLKKARLLSAIIPGAGQFYVHNYWKGIMDFSIESTLIGITAFSLHKTKTAPEDTDEGWSKEDYTILAVSCGMGALAYYVFQLWRLNDDVAVYNYRAAFLKSTFLQLNLNESHCTLALVTRF